MTKINLETLGLEFEAPKGCSYTDGGEVSSVEAAIVDWHIKDFLKRLRFNPKLDNNLMVLVDEMEKKAGPPGFYGICLSHRTPNDDGSISINTTTYVLKGLPEPYATSAKAHEQIHVLAHQGRDDLIKPIIKENPYCQEVEYHSLTEEEKAEIAGCLIVFRKYGLKGTRKLVKQIKTLSANHLTIRRTWYDYLIEGLLRANKSIAAEMHTKKSG